jgi:hypothetical protein
LLLNSPPDQDISVLSTRRIVPVPVELTSRPRHSSVLSTRRIVPVELTSRPRHSSVLSTRRIVPVAVALTSRPRHSSILDKQLDQVRCRRSGPRCQTVAHGTDDVYVAGTQTVHGVRSRGGPGPGGSGLRVAGERTSFRHGLLEFALQLAVNTVSASCP